MRVPWKVVGLAGVAGVAATGAVVARRRRAHHDYDPDELRARLHERLAEATGSGPVEREIRAAGGAVLRDRDGGGVELCVVHRPKYDDWSLPKGKLDRGESFEDAAVREVWEETGLRCRLAQELDVVRYTDGKGRPKVVRYWRMAVIEDTGFAPNDEVDERRWLELPAAAVLMSYEHDAELVASLVAGHPDA